MRWYADVGIAGCSKREVESESLDVQQYGDATDQSVVGGGTDRVHHIADVGDRDEAAVHRGRQAGQNKR